MTNLDSEILKELSSKHNTDFDTNIELDIDNEDYGDSLDVDDSYSAQPKKQALLGANGNVVDYKDVSPMEVIKKLAEQQKIQLKEPKSNCKHCYGRGWIGRLQNGAPLECSCIYPPDVKKKNANIVFENRALKRNKKYKKQKAIQEIMEFNERLKAELKLEKEYQIKAGLRPADME